jgi:hypothetical protein
MIALVTTLISLAVFHYGFDQPLRGSWLTMRWVTGLAGFVGIAGVMTYPARKSIYRRRAGALRYWLLAHIYLGALAAIVLLIHGGRHGGGLLTMTLMLWFDATIVTGIWGMLCYLVIPRLMTSIEGDPLLIEDLEGRRAELRADLQKIRSECHDEVRAVIDQRIARYFSGPGYLLKQFVRREELTTSLAKARLEFKEEIFSPRDSVKRNQLLRTVERWATLRRVEALIYLHRLLKVWIIPHVISTSVMLALMVVHIVQVVFFGLR